VEFGIHPVETDPLIKEKVNHYENFFVVGRGFEPLSVTGKGNRPEPLDEPTKNKAEITPWVDRTLVGLLVPKLIHSLLKSILSVTVG
jgi:hypothetical protein